MEKVKDALEKARVERHERLGIAGTSSSSKTHTSPPAAPAQDIRNMMYISLALMTFSVAGLLFLFWYISDLKRDFIRQDTAQAETGQLLKTPEPVSTNRRLDEQIALETVSSTIDRNPEGENGKGELVDVYFGDALIRMQVVGKLSGDDADYVAALDQLKQDPSSRTSTSTITKEDAETIQAGTADTGKSVDHFNRVIVENTADGKVRNKLSFAGRIQQTVADKTEQASTTSGDQDSYIAKLNQASTERKNETRIIKVRRGDSLWKIARRAYGTGFKYPLIFAANPHLTNPDEIEVGDFIRVPL